MMSPATRTFTRLTASAGNGIISSPPDDEVHRFPRNYNRGTANRNGAPRSRRRGMNNDPGAACACVSASAADSGRRPKRYRRSEEHTTELQSLMRRPYDVFCSKNKKYIQKTKQPLNTTTNIKETETY